MRKRRDGLASIQESTSAPGRFVPQRPGQAQLRLITFNFPSIQETAEKPNEQQQQARRFPSLQEEALSLVILTTSFFRDYSYDVIEHLARKLSSPVSLWCSNRSLSEVENLTLWRLGIVYPWLTDLKLSSYNNNINLFIKFKKKNVYVYIYIYIYIYTHRLFAIFACAPG